MFSDYVLIERILRHIVHIRVASIEDRPPPITPIFRIEAPVAPDLPVEWDVQEELTGDPKILIFEEVKSGDLKKKDRLALWTRIRKTAVALGTEQKLIPRLKVNSDNLPSNPNRWRALGSNAMTAQGTRPIKKVNSASKFAEEALYTLTHAKGEAPLSIEQARKILKLFVFDETIGAAKLIEDIEDQIRKLAVGLGIEELRAMLLGFVSEFGASSTPARHEFRPEELGAKIGIMEKLIKVDPSSATAWRQLRGGNSRIAAGKTAVVPFSPGALAYQDWRTVQPSVSQEFIDRPSLVAITGRGGLGKTVILKKLAEEAEEKNRLVVRLEGNDLRAYSPNELVQALELGAFVGANEGRPLEVYIDAFENAADESARLKEFIAALSSVSKGSHVRVLLSIRATEWTQIMGSQERVPSWRRVQLLDWSNEIVSALAITSRRKAEPSLLALLRTPLVLDLFLRTFSAESSVPENLQTRHALLRAYWERRVLPSDNVSAPARRHLLLRYAEEEASGVFIHESQDEAAQQLASEGVLIGEGGAFAFRHALLRDFTIVMWLAVSEGGATGIINRLAKIKNGVARWQSARALIDASNSERGSLFGSLPTYWELVRKMVQSPGMIEVASDALCELEDPSNLDLTTLVEGVNESVAATFIVRLLISAKSSANIRWLVPLASLPEDADWAQRTDWIHSEFLRHAADLLEFVWKEANHEDCSRFAGSAKAVAIRLREWSSATKFRDLMKNFEGHLMIIVAQHAPSVSTLNWLRDRSDGNSRYWFTRWKALEALLFLVSGAQAIGLTLRESDVLAVYLFGSGLKLVDGVVSSDASIGSWPNQDYERTNIALLGEGIDKHSLGLLDALPNTFLPIVFGMLVGLAQEENERSREALRNIRTGLESLFPSETSFVDNSEAGTLERTLQARAGTPLRQEDVLDRLVDDVDGYDINDHADERGRLIHALEIRLTDSANTGDDFIAKKYWPACKCSRSATAWLLLLEAEAKNGFPHPEIVDELLAKKPLYHIQQATSCLHVAIKARWTGMSSDTQKCVINRIAERRRSPVLGLYDVAPLLVAIPVRDQPEELKDYIRLYELRGVDPAPNEKQENIKVFHEGAKTSQHESEPKNPWEKFFALSRISINSDEFIIAAATRSLKDAIGVEFPSMQMLEKDATPLVAIEMFLETLRRRVAAGRQEVSEALLRDELVGIACWAFDVARSCSVARLNADREIVSVRQAPQDKHLSPWRNAIGVIDETLKHPSLIGNRELTARLMEEVRRVSHDVSPKVAACIFLTVGPNHWRQGGFAEITLLNELLLSSIESPGGLDLGLANVAWVLPEDKFQRLAETILARGRAAEYTRVAKTLGQQMGARAMLRVSGERSCIMVLILQWLRARPVSGLFEQESIYKLWVQSVALGAQSLIFSRSWENEIVVDYVLLVESCWNALRTVPVESVQMFVNSVFLPVFNIPREQGRPQTEVRALWQRLLPMASSVALEGKEDDVFSLVFPLRGHQVVEQLGVESLRPLIDGLDQRAVRLGERLRSAPLNNGHYWLDVYGYAIKFLQTVVTATGGDQLREYVHEVLQRWSRLGIEEAVLAARKIRDYS
ncbi:ATP-binding protein [Cystobacter fuscus]|uniref:ATP-binding protein n=1 Tax=Cystobacter fuscus TaxID=43 RepID=UPI00138AEE61|nr:ATP-binding protein [Cystobacter fuscus]